MTDPKPSGSPLGYFKEGAWIEIKYPMPQKLTLENVARRVGRIEGILGKSLTHHVDIHFRSDSEVIVVGQINGKDFYKRFSFPPQALPDLVKLLERDFGAITQRGRIDVPMDMGRWFLK